MKRRKLSLSMAWPFKIEVRVRRQNFSSWTADGWAALPRRHQIKPIPKESLRGGVFWLWGCFCLRWSDW